MIEPWQIPILVMAVVAGPIVAHELIRLIRASTPTVEGVAPAEPRASWFERRTPTQRQALKTLFWSIIVVVSLTMVILSFGSQAIQILSTAISAVSTLVSTVLAIQNASVMRQIAQVAQVKGETPEGGSG